MLSFWSVSYSYSFLTVDSLSEHVIDNKCGLLFIQCVQFLYVCQCSQLIGSMERSLLSVCAVTVYLSADSHSAASSEVRG